MVTKVARYDHRPILLVICEASIKKWQVGAEPGDEIDAEPLLQEK
jgi:hypothetical protein